MNRLLMLIVVLILAATAIAEPADPPATRTSAAVTDRGRSLDQILRVILTGENAPGPRTLVIVLDPSPALVTARFADTLEEALTSIEAPDLALGLALVGEDGPLRVTPGRDRAAIVAAIREALRAPRNDVSDVMAAIRVTAQRMKGRDGRREIALVSLENGDGESDIEATAGYLARTGTVLHAVGRAAFLADSYWVHATTGRPRDLDMRGQDAAYDDLPWGWILQRHNANESVSSGFGLFGPSRLVEASGGRYFVFYPPSTAASQCCPYSGCRLCAGDHADCGTSYQTHKLRDIAPPLVSRLETRRILARDPVFLAILRVWGEASGEGLLYSRPPLRAGPGLLREERRRTTTLTPLLGSSNFSGVARRAGKLAESCERLAAEIKDALAYADPAKTSQRSIAIAETMHAQLLVTRLNLRLLQAFCAEAPAWLARPADGIVAPEAPLFAPDRDDYVGISVNNQCFCHGPEEVLRLEIPGLVEAEEERVAAFEAVKHLTARYDGTPFGRVGRTMGIAIYYLSVRGRLLPTPRRIPGTEDDDETTSGGKERPARGGTGDGSGGGATTGGK